jgi:hypothetical protein
MCYRPLYVVVYIQSKKEEALVSAGDNPVSRGVIATNVPVRMSQHDVSLQTVVCTHIVIVRYKGLVPHNQLTCASGWDPRTTSR